MLKTFGVVLLVLNVCFAAIINVGPNRSIKDPALAVAQMTGADTMVLDDGTYKTTFDIPPGKDGFTIKSASGNPYACLLDGQGGVPNHRLAWGKGIIHTRSAGTVLGIGFINGGGDDGKADGEAGFYAELFATPGVINIVNCSFDGNENGIFAPGGSSGANVSMVINNCIFSKNKGNGVITEGTAHNIYVSCNKLTAIDNLHYPSMYGNNFKSRSLEIYIADKWNKHGPGRCLDIPSGGKLTVRGGVYTSVGPTAVANFFNYAGENTNSGIFEPDIDGMTIVGARTNDAIWNNVPSITVTFKNTIQMWAKNTNPSFRIQGNIAGIVTSPPSGTVFVDIPEPPLPAWALPNGGTSGSPGAATSATSAAAAASTSTSAKAATTTTTTAKGTTTTTTAAATTTTSSAKGTTTTTTAAAASTSTSSKGSTTTTTGTPATQPPVTQAPTPAPNTPAPTTPAPSTPKPTGTPTTPAPGTPAPGTPAPSTPAPSTPAPGTPAPGTPAPDTSTTSANIETSSATTVVCGAVALLVAVALL